MATAPLATQACRRLCFGFRPNTLASYERMFQLFLAFLVAVDLSLPRISSLDYLPSWNIWHSLVCLLTISQTILLELDLCALYMAPILHHLETKFRDKSLKITRPLAPIVKIIIDHTLLLQIVTVSAQLQFPLVYKALYILGFFSFLRISNILPYAAKNFDTTGHLCGGV